MNKWGIDWTQESTKRGAILSFFGIIALGTALYHGESSAAVLGIGTALAGAMGWLRKD